MDNPNSITVTVGGKELKFETGKIARQANGSVVLTCGETMLLSTACMSSKPSEDIDFIPLRVDYIEKFSAAGKTLGGFIKREGKPTEREVLLSRQIDRPIRPMFEDGYFHDTQVLSYVLSYDGVHQPEPLGICAASAALVLSDIPFIKPIAAVKVGMIDDQFIINPSIEQQKDSKLDLMLAGTEDAILMIEGFCDFLTEEQILVALEEGSAAISIICKKLAEWRDMIGKPKNRTGLHVPPEALFAEMDALVSNPLREAMHIADKLERETALSKISSDVSEKFLPKDETPLYKKADVQLTLKKLQSKYMREMLFKDHKRCDGRRPEDIRHISVETGLLPRAHGSALFTRGETQTIAVATLGGPNMAMRFEDISEEGARSFYLQYFFPPFSVGEVGRMGPPGRREVGHGKLAERSIGAVLPAQNQFPYTIRLESNITESNGSSSMATVCGGCLAMMDAGVPLKRPIAGIAMGLMLEEENFVILSDILGIEDGLGDMDFKVTGDEKGITAFQLDIKVEGITQHIMQVALAQAKEGRIHILNEMLKALPKSRGELSTHAPRIEQMQVKPSKIATIIGPGGKMIRHIIEESGANIDINDDGIVSITATHSDHMEKAKDMIINLTSEVEVGKTYNGVIESIADFGLFVQIFATKGLCHISEVSHSRVENLDELFKAGDPLKVKVLDINNRGQIKLSHKVLLEREPV